MIMHALLPLVVTAAGAVAVTEPVNGTSAQEGLTDYFGRPETCVLIRVNVPDPETGLGPDEPPVQVAAVDLESDFSWCKSLEQTSRSLEGGVLSVVVRVPVTGRVGFAAYSPARGYAEVLVEAGTWEQGLRVPAKAEEVPTVELRLPPRSPVSGVRILPEYGLKPDSFASVRYNAELPLTRMEVETRYFDRAAKAEPFAFQLPAGSYVIEGSPHFRGCGVGAAMEDTGTALLERVECCEGAPIQLAHRIEEGGSLRLHIDVDGAPKGAAKFLESEPGQRRSTAWFDPMHDPADRWYATATMERIPKKGEALMGSTALKPTEVVWGWYEQSTASGRMRAPLCMGVYTTRVYPPGRYRLRLEGPLIEPQAVEVTIAPEELGRGGWRVKGMRRISVRARR